MMADQEEVVYTKPTSQVDLEERLSEDYQSSLVLQKDTNPGAAPVDERWKLEDNDTSAYVGVSPEYQNYANETDKPLRSEEGVQATLEEQLYTAYDGNKEDAEKADEKQADQSDSEAKTFTPPSE
jgi:hypothetical protein